MALKHANPIYSLQRSSICDRIWDGPATGARSRSRESCYRLARPVVLGGTAANAESNVRRTHLDRPARRSLQQNYDPVVVFHAASPLADVIKCQCGELRSAFSQPNDTRTSWFYRTGINRAISLTYVTENTIFDRARIGMSHQWMSDHFAQR
jgi:hypothetical protein